MTTKQDSQTEAWNVCKNSFINYQIEWIDKMSNWQIHRVKPGTSIDK